MNGKSIWPFRFVLLLLLLLALGLLFFAGEMVLRAHHYIPLFSKGIIRWEWEVFHLQETVDAKILENKSFPVNYSDYDHEINNSGSRPIRTETNELLENGATSDINSLLTEWNLNFIRSIQSKAFSGRGSEDISFYYNDFCFAFEPYDSTIFPAYRFMTNAQYPYSNFHTNQFGFTGSELELEKPDSVIRILFLGASTTQIFLNNGYPDYVGLFLNQWARKKKLRVGFEVINAGRAVLRSMDFKNILKYEALPLNPDIVIYYEGRNQFVLSKINDYRENFPLYARILARSILIQRTLLLLHISPFSIIEKARVSAYEKKNRNWRLYSEKYLPVNLNQILNDLGEMKTVCDSIHTQFILCSFPMKANDQILNPETSNSGAYTYWLQELSGLPVEVINYYNGVENEYFRKFATSNNTPFFDIEKELEAFPEIFSDGIHLHEEGLMYQGWLVFTRLTKLLEPEIKAGILPRQNRDSFKVHPYINRPPFKVQLGF